MHPATRKREALIADLGRGQHHSDMAPWLLWPQFVQVWIVLAMTPRRRSSLFVTVNDRSPTGYVWHGVIFSMFGKGNCSDLRNPSVVDVVEGLRDCAAQVGVREPWADPEEARHECGLDLIASRAADACALRNHGRYGEVVYDLRRVFAREDCDLRP